MTLGRAAAVDRVRVAPQGVVIAGEPVPLLSAAVHYFRMSRAHWRPALEACLNLGARFVDTYVPWSVHERAQGDYDFGQGDPRKDVAAFVRLSGELGLGVIVRPGPHINAELTGFGIPERVLWDERCQARSRRGKPVVLPQLPRSFPVPSYASRAFFDEASLWLAAVARLLAPLTYPDGPIALVQVDNEGAMYFRDGLFDQDFHPDALDQYRRFIRKKYEKTPALRDAHADESLTFDTVAPPGPFDPEERPTPAPYLDWAEFQEVLLGGAMYRFATILRRNGLSSVATFHNLPMVEHATPLDPARLAAAVDFVGADYYHPATPTQLRKIAERTTELATRSAAAGAPCYGAEMAAGFPPQFPPFSERDNPFNVLSAMAYGLRGFNVYMAVGRDRWVGGPIRSDGTLRDESEFWSKLFAAFERTHFDELRRRVPVQIVVPRDARRWSRIAHAFGPVSNAAFHLQGDGDRRGAFEEPFADDCATPAELEAFVHNLHAALERARVPFGYTTDDLLDGALESAAWTIFLSSGWARRATIEALAFAVMGKKAVSLGPRVPVKNEIGRELGASMPEPENAAVPLQIPTEPPALDTFVSKVTEMLSLPHLGTEPAAVHTTLHEDAEGKSRVLFVINPTESDHQARVAAPGAKNARNALTGRSVPWDGDHLALLVPAQTVVMLELSPA